MMARAILTRLRASRAPINKKLKIDVAPCSAQLLRIMNRACTALFLCAMFSWSTQALSQTYPAKPVRVIVPLAAGGPTDVLARTISQNLPESWGQMMVIDNRPGANTNIGSVAV